MLPEDPQSTQLKTWEPNQLVPKGFAFALSLQAYASMTTYISKC